MKSLIGCLVGVSDPAASQSKHIGAIHNTVIPICSVCSEFVWALQCFQHCKDDLAPGVSYSYPPRYEHLQTVIYKFCEPQWEGQDKSEYST